MSLNSAGRIVLFRGGPLDGQRRVMDPPPGCAIVVPDYRTGPPFGQFRYEFSGHRMGGAELWTLAPWEPD